VSEAPVAPPRHTSLEREFFAAVPPRPAPLLRRVSWRLLLWLVALPPVVAILRKRVER
jgi:hypothetical protein